MNLSYDEITDIVINYSIVIHRRLGPGLLESVYEMILCRMLQRHGLKVDRQLGISFDSMGCTSTKVFESTCSSKTKL